MINIRLIRPPPGALRTLSQPPCSASFLDFGRTAAQVPVSRRIVTSQPPPSSLFTSRKRCNQSRGFHSATILQFRLWSRKPKSTTEAIQASQDPRLAKLGRTLSDEYAVIRDKYRAPKYPIVLCHGLLGFDELRLAGKLIPAIAYWRGIGEALKALGVEVITTTVPASGSIEARAASLLEQIEKKAAGRSVNLVGHSMGGIDCRYMISKLKPEGFKVVSLTTIATPHRGSSFADYVFKFIGKQRLPKLYHIMEMVGLETGAFAQLTTKYMEETFNPACPDVEGVKYFSYGAAASPGIFSMFRSPQKIIYQLEGPNDGLVSVKSAMHGEYKGTLIGPSHLDIINWTNRLRWMISERRFNAIAFYCDIADMLAEEGL